MDSFTACFAMSLAASVSLPDVSVSRADIASMRRRLRAYYAHYTPFFGLYCGVTCMPT